MRQLLLDLDAENAQTLDTFVVGQNQELLQLLRFYARCGSAMPQDRFVYLWGEPSAGKTHLLQALARSPRARYLPVSMDPESYSYLPQVRLYLMDDCDRLPEDCQIAAFALYNQVRENGGLLVAAGALPPTSLTLREDLRTRLGWGLIYQLHGLSDEEKIAALTRIAHSRGITLSSGVLPYLITHFRRDMQFLSAMLDALDKYSLETQRPITLPLLRNLLQREDALKIN